MREFLQLSRLSLTVIVSKKTDRFYFGISTNVALVANVITNRIDITTKDGNLAMPKQSKY